MASYTIIREVSARIAVRRSIFAAQAGPVINRDSVQAFLAKVKTVEAGADHYCYAYILGDGRRISHGSDGGEPYGAAGRPILNALVAAGVIDAMVVVARYFGGTKLGFPGLAAAYQTAASNVLAKASRAVHRTTRVFIVRLPYSKLDRVRYTLRIYEAEELGVTFGTLVELRITVPVETWKELVGALAALGLYTQEV